MNTELKKKMASLLAAVTILSATGCASKTVSPEPETEEPAPVEETQEQVETQPELPTEGVANATEQDLSVVPEGCDPIFDKDGKLYAYYNPVTEEVVKLVEEKVETFVDINDEEALAEYASKIADEINTNIPNYEISTDEVISMIKWINGASVNNATETEFVHVINSYCGLLNMDKNQSLKPFNFSALYLSKNANAVASQVETARNLIVSKIGTDEVDVAINDMAELFAKVNFKLGDKPEDKYKNVAVNANRLYPTELLFINATMLQTQGLADSIPRALYYDKDGQQYALETLIKAYNGTQCVEYSKEDASNLDNGDSMPRVNEIFDKFSSDYAQALKQVQEASDVKTLTLN